MNLLYDFRNLSLDTIFTKNTIEDNFSNSVFDSEEKNIFLKWLLTVKIGF